MNILLDYEINLNVLKNLVNYLEFLLYNYYLKINLLNYLVNYLEFL